MLLSILTAHYNVTIIKLKFKNIWTVFEKYNNTKVQYSNYLQYIGNMAELKNDTVPYATPILKLLLTQKVVKTNHYGFYGYLYLTNGQVGILMVNKYFKQKWFSRWDSLRWFLLMIGQSHMILFCFDQSTN